MPSARRAHRQPTDGWQQLRLLVTSAEQEAYELLRPIVLFGRSSADRARETGVPARTLRRRAARFADAGMRSLFEPDEPPAPDRRMLPLGIRKAIVELKAECPALRPYEIASICRHRFGRAGGHHTVERVLASEPVPLHPPRRFPRYRDIPDPVAHRKAIVDLYGAPRLYATGHASPQSFLPPLDETDWRPAQRLAPYRDRRRQSGAGRQAPLFEAAREEAVG